MRRTERTTPADKGGKAAGRPCRELARPFGRPRATPFAYLLNARAEGYVLDRGLP